MADLVSGRFPQSNLYSQIFGERLGRAPAEIDNRLRTGFRRAGDLVAGVAQARAAPKGTEVVAHPFGIGAVIHATNVHGGGTAALEHHGDPGTFRHPVFGNRANWVSQAAHPFLHPALEANRETVVQIIRAAMEEVLVTL